MTCPLSTAASSSNMMDGTPARLARAGSACLLRTAHESMAHIVTDGCINCKYTCCVSVCPTDCFREGPNFLVIEPNECVDCSMCARECPADAVHPAHATPRMSAHFSRINLELAMLWPAIRARRERLRCADRWRSARCKLHLLRGLA
ncbi:Ferredoxin 1 [Candidatus Tremblaya princeps]|uniref:Ferredoxin n=1 Tax=Tremblaya princeps TaxID=189385 RepID=A0A143WN94_TREPR|nr:Ferredoxin 1 [Candidatus Tremblaya princeps]